MTLLNVSDDAPEDIDPVVYRIVDQMESDPAQNKLSIQSPAWQSLDGKTIEDDVNLSLPKGHVIYEILNIQYGPRVLELRQPLK